jgi:hypothetical protein
MAAAQALVSPCGNLGRRRSAVAAARMAPSAVRIGGSWKKNAFLGGRLAVGSRKPRSRSLVASPVQVNRDFFWGEYKFGRSKFVVCLKPFPVGLVPVLFKFFSDEDLDIILIDITVLKFPPFA